MFRSVYAEIQLNIPFENHQPIVELQIANGIDLGFHHRSPRSMKHMMDVISREFHRKLVNHLSEQRNPMSILMDSTTDLSRNHYLIVYFQTIEDHRPVIYFYKLIELGYDESAQGLMNALKAELAKDNLDTLVKETLVGYAADGASTMMGPKSGLGVKLEEFVGRKLFIIHCMSHRLHLAIRHALETVGFGEFEADINSVYTFYSRGHKRLAHLKHTAEELHEHFYRLTYIHEVRWIASEYSSLTKIQKNWHIIVEDLGQIRVSPDFPKDVQTKATVLLEKMIKKAFVLKLHFLLDVLRHLVYFSKVIQRKGSNVIGKHRIQHNLMEVILQLKTVHGENINLLLQDSKCDGVSPCTMQRFLIGDVQLKGVWLRTTEFDYNALKTETLDRIIEELTINFPNLELSIFEVFDPRNIPGLVHDIEGYGKNEIYALSRFFKMNALDLYRDWNLVLHAIRESSVSCLHQLSHAEIFWPKVLTAEDVHVSPSLSLFLKRLIVLPIGSSECERGFTILSHIRSSRRSTLTQKSMEDSLRIRINGPKSTNEFNALPYVLKWIAEGHMRTDDPTRSGHRGVEPDDEDSSKERFFAQSTLL